MPCTSGAMRTFAPQAWRRGQGRPWPAPRTCEGGRCAQACARPCTPPVPGSLASWLQDAPVHEHMSCTGTDSERAVHTRSQVGVHDAGQIDIHLRHIPPSAQYQLITAFQQPGGTGALKHTWSYVFPERLRGSRVYASGYCCCSHAASPLTPIPACALLHAQQPLRMPQTSLHSRCQRRSSSALQQAKADESWSDHMLAAPAL